MDFLNFLIRTLRSIDSFLVTLMERRYPDDELDTPVEAPKPPKVEVPPPPPPVVYLWNTPAYARHSVRVICDEEGLSVADKNLICAVIEAESQFYNTAINRNKNKLNKVTSTDWGICQINDRYHIGPSLSFPSVEYVVANPDKVVRWMISMFKVGKLNLWVAYSSGAYKKYLV